MAIKKCLKEVKKLPRASYPLGNTSQFSKPVLPKIIKRMKDITLTFQSFEDFPLDIRYPLLPMLFLKLIQSENCTIFEKFVFCLVA
jgi:hypothetical protein